jgi:hypothetical protein
MAAEVMSTTTMCVRAWRFPLTMPVATDNASLGLH